MNINRCFLLKVSYYCTYNQKGLTSAFLFLILTEFISFLFIFLHLRFTSDLKQLDENFTQKRNRNSFHGMYQG